MSTPGQTIVSLRGVGKTFERGTVALDGFGLDVRDGEFVSLLGPVRLREINCVAYHRGLECRIRGCG